MPRDKAATAYRQNLAMELRTSGYSYDDIAEVIGYADRSGAWRAVQNALAKKTLTSVDRYRMLRFAELEAEHRRTWAAAHAGDFRALDQCIRALDERVKLMGFENGL